MPGPYFSFDPVANRATNPSVKYANPVKAMTGESAGSAPAVDKLDGTAQLQSAANPISNTAPAATTAQSAGGIPAGVSKHDGISLSKKAPLSLSKSAGYGCADLVE